MKAALDKPLPAFTSRTVIDPAAILDEVATARARGYSVMDQGFEEGVFSVAAAILGWDGYAFGTLAIAAPVVRTSKAAAAERGAAVAAAAREISERLNGEGFDARRGRVSA